MAERSKTPYMEPNTFWAIKGERSGFFYRNNPDGPGAIYTKRINRRWSTEDGCISARNDVEGWYTEMFEPVEMRETFVKEHPAGALLVAIPSSKIPEENSLVCFDVNEGRYYKKGSGFTAKSLNSATHFPSFKKVAEVIRGLEPRPIQVIELHSEVVRSV